MLDNQSYYSSRLIFAKAKYYPTKVQIFIPIIPFSRDEHASSDTSFSETSKNDDELNLERSLRRTKQRISDYVLCNQFELFVTFTFAKNRQDINEKRRQMANWLKNQRKRNGKFDYLIVSEFHKDRQSLHFSCFVLWVLRSHKTCNKTYYQHSYNTKEATNIYFAGVYVGV